MPDFTSTLPDTHFRVPQRTLRTLLESYRQEQCTGLMRLRYPSGMDLVSTFLDGTQTGLYGCLNHKMEVIPRQSWTYAMDRPDASIAFLNLTVEAMRLGAYEYLLKPLELDQLSDLVERVFEGSPVAAMRSGPAPDGNTASAWNGSWTGF